MVMNWLSYPRGLFLVFWGIWHTAIMSIVVLAIVYTTRSLKIIDFAIQKLWSWPFLWMAGIDWEVRGKENVSTDGKGFLILFNHSSHYDIPLLYYLFPRSFRFGAKIELFKIPFFGKAMERCGVLPIDRGNRNKVMKVYENAIARINQGECFALAPEGTRQDEPRIGKFKRGPFEFAINAQMDIVPVVLAGAFEVFSKKQILIAKGKWRHKVIMQITSKISTAGMGIEDVENLQELVHQQMERAFNQIHPEVLVGR